jgi:hypothetical protein
MKKKTIEAVAAISSLPRSERKQAAAAALMAGDVIDFLGGSPRPVPLAGCRDYSAYRARVAGGKKNILEVLEVLGIEIGGRNGGAGSKVTARVKKD